MKFSLSTVAFLLVASIVQATPVAIRSQKDVYVPAIFQPTSGAQWKVGSSQFVTWDVSSPPEHITNKKGRIVLSRNGTLLLDYVLGKDFDILCGNVTVKVPQVEPGSDYQVVLFGDSGNYSPSFNIVSRSFF